MKVAEVITGNQYLFHKTDIAHKKDMEGTIVTISSRKRRGKGRVYIGNGQISVTGGHIVFKTTDGRNVAACELMQIPDNQSLNK